MPIRYGLLFSQIPHGTLVLSWFCFINYNLITEKNLFAVIGHLSNCRLFTAFSRSEKARWLFFLVDFIAS